MGTRNLFTIIHDGKVKLAKYNQWDGDLEGQGKALSSFIVNDLDIDELIQSLDRISFVDESFFENVEFTQEKFPLLCRDCGIENTLKILTKGEYTTDELDHNYNRVKVLIKNRDILYTLDHSDFIKDGLFCEYAYTLNLDDLTVTVFKGGNNVLFKCDIFQYPDTLDKFINQQKEERI